MVALSGRELMEVDTESNTFGRVSNEESVRDGEELLWAAVERLPSVMRLNAAVLRRMASELGRSGESEGVIETLEVRKLDQSQRELLLNKALATSEQDNINLLSGIKQRLTRLC